MNDGGSEKFVERFLIHHAALQFKPGVSPDEKLLEEGIDGKRHNCGVILKYCPILGLHGVEALRKKRPQALRGACNRKSGREFHNSALFLKERGKSKNDLRHALLGICGPGEVNRMKKVGGSAAEELRRS